MPIIITALVDGFRRAGLAHHGTVTYEDGRFTEEQLAQLRAEPNLVVAVTDSGPAEVGTFEIAVDEPPAPAAPTADGGGGKKGKGKK